MKSKLFIWIISMCFITTHSITYTAAPQEKVDSDFKQLIATGSGSYGQTSFMEPGPIIDPGINITNPAPLTDDDVQPSSANLNSSSASSLKQPVPSFKIWIKQQSKNNLRDFLDKGRGVYDIDGNLVDEDSPPIESLQQERTHFYYFLLPKDTKKYLTINKKLHQDLTQMQFDQLIKKNNAFLERLYNLKNNIQGKKPAIKPSIKKSISKKSNAFKKWLNNYDQAGLLSFLDRGRCEYDTDGKLPEGADISQVSWDLCPYYSLSLNPNKEQEYLQLNKKLNENLSRGEYNHLVQKHRALLEELYNTSQGNFLTSDN